LGVNWQMGWSSTPNTHVRSVLPPKSKEAQ
jgi:hypothetical protein